jgi:hypothetical protein
LSFFDEADEPGTAPRTTSRSRRPSGGGRRPPTDQQAIQIRRAIAAVAIIVVVILIILGIHSCQVSARNSALKDYFNSMNSLIQRSNQTGAQLFQQLSGGGGASNATGLQTQINATRIAADGELSDAHKLSVPSEVDTGHGYLLLALQMRDDGIKQIAANIQQALGTTASKDAVDNIATGAARFYSSDVVYKDYVVPQVLAALKSASVTPPTPPNPGQFLPNLGWLTPNFVASQLHVALPQPPSTKCVPGQPVGHALNSVSVAGTTLQTGSTNTVSANPAPTFTLSITNAGKVALSNVPVTVTVEGTSVTGQSTVSTTPGQTTTVNVTLSSSPPTGQTYTLQATVKHVHCGNVGISTLTFPVTFQ